MFVFVNGIPPHLSSYRSVIYSCHLFHYDICLQSICLYQLISLLRHIGMGCHMNGLFTGVIIYGDDITLLAPSRASLALMLEQCESFSRTHDILFNASKKQNIRFSSVVR